MKPSFKKVLRDLSGNKSRSLIVLFAIILGSFGVSMMSTAYNLLGKNLSENYLRTNPASFTVVADSISEEVLQKVKQLENIEAVEIRSKIDGRVEVSPNEFIPVWLYVVDDFRNVQINKFRMEDGNLPASANEVLIERTGKRLTSVALNRELSVTIGAGAAFKLNISGIVHDPGQAPSWMEGILYGYVGKEFVATREITQIPAELKVRIRNNPYDLGSIENKLKETLSLLGKSQIKVLRTEILPPGRHIHQSQMTSMMFLLQMFGVLALLLSCFIIINMVMAIMTKEIRQIGIMKAIGASTKKIASIYLSIVLLFGFAATLFALPVGFHAGMSYARFVASMLNFELFNTQISHGVWLFQVAIGTLLPAVVAFIPVYRGSRISVREALNNYGVKDSLSLYSGSFSRLLNHIKLPNSTIFAIRNTFRRKGRLILTLVALVLGGAVFISTFNIRTSLKETVKSRFTNQRYDVQAIFEKGISETEFRESIEKLPFVSEYEIWGFTRATQLLATGLESEQINLNLAPLKTSLFVPELFKGRWLSDNPNEAVINHVFLSKFPGTKTDSTITLKVNGKIKTFKVVGIIRELFSPQSVYVNRSVLNEWPTMSGRLNCSLIAFNPEKYADKTANSIKLEQWFKLKKYPVAMVFEKDHYKELVIDHLVVITTMLIMVSLLLILVGGLGLITAMGISITERLRELAILRAVGVTSQKILQITITEGFVIGLLSWALASILSIPLSYFLGNKFFSIFFQTTLNFEISATGILLWFAVVVAFSAAAVIIPVTKANNERVAVGLSYE